MGHAFSLETLKSVMPVSVENAFCNAIRVLKEKRQLYDRLATKMRDKANSTSAARFEEKAKGAMRDAGIIRQIVIKNENKR